MNFRRFGCLLAAVVLAAASPGRFIVGVDSSATLKNLKDYNKRVKKIRTALGGLSPETARKIATENMHRVFRLP